MPYSTFVFVSYKYVAEIHALEFVYGYDDALRFTERLFLPEEAKWNDSATLTRLSFALHMALGMSYWKAYALPNIRVKSGSLNRREADFWNTVYTKGLGEFFFKNGIDFRGLVNFPITEKADEIFQDDLVQSERVLLPLGGGKDSATSAVLLQKAWVAFDTFALGNYDLIANQAQLLEGKHWVVRREMDEKLFQLNQKGVYNGHVPISVIYGLSALLIAVLRGHQAVVLSNERSANEGNVEYLGEMVNHQWSKGVEFERIFQDYLKKSVSPKLQYFSLLRPFSELKIAQVFAELWKWPEFCTSCNRNFTQKHEGPAKWCGECAKCVFVFICLATSISKEKLLNMFGKNILADETLWPMVLELLGKGETKPFDCVGTPEEVLVAFQIIVESGEYQGDVLVQKVEAEILSEVSNIEEMRTRVFTSSNDHALPDAFVNVLLDLQLL